ncbi:folate-sensitive fragile site protein Fra10Ac1-domain-containing protein [Trametes elegans]|nr:folate-sensitive fragile site protein Fra10Ac1-domain-containing protein [Trametes elegans]
MALIDPKGAGSSTRVGTSEFDILKSSHKFLRDEDDRDESHLSWDEKLAKKYYSSLYREYAVCDLKHYKSGNFALRWRTENEVLSGAGETTCGNTRCPLHSELPEEGEDIRPALTTLELPFSYLEHGESKFALVKVVLCQKCVEKLMYKRNKEKEKAQRRERHAGREVQQDVGHPEHDRPRQELREKRRADIPNEGRSHRRTGERAERERGERRRRSSRSRSPRRRTEEAHSQ